MCLTRLTPLILAVFSASPAQALLDNDGDGVPNRADALPCDPRSAALAYAPGESERGLLLFEDMWPAAGDLDFNDLALSYHYEARVDASGAVSSLRVTYDVLAIGGILDNGLGLHLPLARDAVARVTRTIDGQSVALTPAADAELTVAVASSLRAALGWPAGIVNALPSEPRVSAASIVVDIELATPQPLPMGAAPFDVFMFRSDRPAHEIHLPGYAGTAAMDTALFGTADDASAPGRRFVDGGGLPFVLVIPSSATYPREGVALSSLYPDVVRFAQSGGAQGADFYTRPVAAHAYVDSLGQGRAPLPALLVSAVDRACVPPPCAPTSAQTTCGVGACLRSVAQCVDGEPGVCAPGLPTAEVCNGADDDCNGVADDIGCGMVADERAIGTSGRHTCAVRTGGTVECWGEYHLGTTFYASSPRPQPVQNVTGAVGVAVGGAHACALIGDGTVRCWGANNHRQLGDGTTTNRVQPITVPGISTAVALAADDMGTCAVLADRTVRCWGLFPLGDGRTTDYVVAPAAVPGISGAVDVAMGGAHACALLGSGRVRCWGDNTQGQLGNGTTTRALAPVEVPGITTAVGISASDENTCVVLADRTARCWGSNFAYQVGIGTSSAQVTSPATVLTATGQPLGDVVEIRTSAIGTCARQSTGAVQCWSNSGVIAGYRPDAATPATRPDLVPGVSGAEALAVGYNSRGVACAMTAGGRIQCWGHNDNGQLGSGSAGPARGTPTGVCPDCLVNNLAAGRDTTCAVSSGSPSRAVCWGYGSTGLIPGAGNLVPNPTAISGTDNAAWIAVGAQHACMARTDGSAVCWGQQAAGRVGTRVSNTQIAGATVVAGVSGVVATAVGEQHSCALDSGGMVTCWGRNAEGQVGIGSFSSATSPVLIPQSVAGLTEVTELRAGRDHVCALRMTGDVWCWGGNGVGQLGDGTFTHRARPVRVIGLTDVVRLGIDSFSDSSCAVLADGTARCWGSNNYAQLGDGTTVTNQAGPRVVSGLTNVVDIKIGGNSACATRTDGRLVCWGRNNDGQHGNGTTSNSVIMTKSLVNDITTASGVTMGGNASTTGYACARLANGGARCWGRNGSGQLGNGTTQPAEVSTPSSLVAF